MLLMKHIGRDRSFAPFVTPALHSWGDRVGQTACCDTGGLLKKLRQFRGIAEERLPGSGPNHQRFHMCYNFSSFLSPTIFKPATVSLLSSEQLIPVKFTMEVSEPEALSAERITFVISQFYFKFSRWQMTEVICRRKAVRPEKNLL